MIVIKSLSECDNPAIDEKHQPLLRMKMQHLLDVHANGNEAQYFPDRDGYLVYVQAYDVGSPLSALDMDRTLAELPFEGIEFCKHSQCFDAVLVSNNSFAYQFIIPDACLNPSTRQALQQQLDSGNDEGDSL